MQVWKHRLTVINYLKLFICILSTIILVFKNILQNKKTDSEKSEVQLLSYLMARAGGAVYDAVMEWKTYQLLFLSFL